MPCVVGVSPPSATVRDHARYRWQPSPVGQSRTVAHRQTRTEATQQLCSPMDSETGAWWHAAGTARSPMLTLPAQAGALLGTFGVTENAQPDVWAGVHAGRTHVPRGTL